MTFISRQRKTRKDRKMARHKRTKEEREVYYDGFYGLREWNKFCNMKVSDISASEDDRMRKRLVWVIQWKDEIIAELKKLGFDESVCAEQFWNVIHDAEDEGKGKEVHELRFLGMAYGGRVGMVNESYEKAWVYTLEECCSRSIEITFATKEEFRAFYELISWDDEMGEEADEAIGIWPKGWTEPMPLYELAHYEVTGRESFEPEDFVRKDKVPNREQFIGKRMYIGVEAYDYDGKTGMTDAIKVRALEVSKDSKEFTFKECMFNFGDEDFEGYGYRRLA